MTTNQFLSRNLYRSGQHLKLQHNGRFCVFVVLAAEIIGLGKVNSYTLTRVIHTKGV